jgi:hypothetical protein
MADPKKQKPSKADMKARPTPAGIASETEDEIVVERFLNKGVKVTLSDESTLTIKEIPSWDMLDLAKPLLQWISKFKSQEDGTDTIDVIADLMTDKELREKLFDIFSAFARTSDRESFNRLLPRDVTAIVSAIRKVVRQEEIEALFLAMGTVDK